MIVIFEDEIVQNLMPLTALRPVYHLRCGMSLLGEKIIRNYPGEEVTFHARAILADVLREKFAGIKVNEFGEDKGLFINGRLLFSESLKDVLTVDGEDTIWRTGDKISAARLSGENFSKILGRLSGKEEVTPEGCYLKNTSAREETLDAVLISYPWDLIHNNPDEIKKDFKQLVPSPSLDGKVYDGVHILNEGNIHIEEGAQVKPGVVLNAEGGPIFIAKDARILPNAVIEGPCYIGEKTSIKTMAKIYEGTSIGPVCKVGGEVEESIIHAYSNKQHDGFLGHAYVAEWVNLGADTNNSDLKNNYGSVKVFINGKVVDSGSMFVGLTIGDHSKAGINTMFNTGTVVGTFCNVFGAGFPDKFIPDFSWGGVSSTIVHNPDKAIAVAEKVMKRRGIELSAAERTLYRKRFELTEELRSSAGVTN